MAEPDQLFFEQFMNTHDMSAFWNLVQTVPSKYTIGETLTLSLPLSIDDLVESCELSMSPRLAADPFNVHVFRPKVSATGDFLMALLHDGTLHIQLIPTPASGESRIQIQFDRDADVKAIDASTASILVDCINRFALMMSWYWKWRLSFNNEVVFTLNTTLGRFADWLKHQFGFSFGPNIGRRIHLHGPSVQAVEKYSSRSVITIAGRKMVPLNDLVVEASNPAALGAASNIEDGTPTESKVQPPRSRITRERAGLRFTAIEYVVDELASERITVTATCHSPWVFERFCLLLEGITKTWPEAMEGVNTLLNRVRQAEGDASSSATMLFGPRLSATNIGDAQSKRRRRGPRVQPLDEMERTFVEQWLSAKERGKRQNAWCLEHGVTPRTLIRWLKKYKDEKSDIVSN